VFAGTSFGPPRRRLISTITGHLVTAEDDMARLLAGQVTRPVPIPAALPLRNTDQRGPHGAALTQALAALFTAGALTDLTPFLPGAGAGEERRAREAGTRGGREMSGSTLASRTVPRMRAAEEAGPSGPAPGGAVSCGGGGKPGPFGNLTG
jgi:hypothetical protein